jgi:hypothetical protein
MALTAGMTVDQLSKADLCYAAAVRHGAGRAADGGNVARNKLDGVWRV